MLLKLAERERRQREQRSVQERSPLHYVPAGWPDRGKRLRELTPDVTRVARSGRLPGCQLFCSFFRPFFFPSSLSVFSFLP